MDNKVAVITGFYKSPFFLKTLFEKLNNQTFKNFDVFVYTYEKIDNEEEIFGQVVFKYYLIHLNKNVGFAGGNNAAILEAKKNYDYKYYALINDDTKPCRDWLHQLVSLAKQEENVGAVSSKLVYYEKFLKINGEIDTIEGDGTRLIRLYNNSGFEDCSYPKKFFFKGGGLEEEDEIYKFKWLDSRFEFAFPIRNDDDRNSFKLKLFIKIGSMAQGQELRLSIGDHDLEPIKLQKDKVYYELSVPFEIGVKNSVHIIQNAGSDFDEFQNGFDIGSGCIDSEDYGIVKELRLFCGGACLITKEALIKAGLFEELFFSYYEDSDLSLRIRKHGFKILYNPNAVVMHYHSATSVEWSPFFTYHVFRNKIIFSYRNFGVKAFFRSYKERLIETKYFLRLVYKSKFRNVDLNARLRLNLSILKDSIIGIAKYSPTKFK